ncbi:hypothetical protein [Thermaerobacter composti]|uniref:Head-tail adaptor protein n=1 Tax=Thermaerobacter composti TaxID=554949 RepID=A0ABZ0QS40_9FIRM|nr:hypothetical protein [Thermaerobacter composti]WPD20181.1 hypothetical protein Q5761_06005 [Thermaerobacter composti]
MSTLKALRGAHARLIAENPVQVTVTRTTSTRKETGGRSKQETVLPAFTGRLVPRNLQPEATQTEAGTQRVFDWLLLAPHDADLKATDRLEADGRTFRVVRVIERKLGGEVFAKQATLEEVQ